MTRRRRAPRVGRPNLFIAALVLGICALVPSVARAGLADELRGLKGKGVKVLVVVIGAAEQNADDLALNRRQQVPELARYAASQLRVAVVNIDRSAFRPDDLEYHAKRAAETPGLTLHWITESFPLSGTVGTSETVKALYELMVEVRKNGGFSILANAAYNALDHTAWESVFTTASQQEGIHDLFTYVALHYTDKPLVCSTLRADPTVAKQCSTLRRQKSRPLPSDTALLPRDRYVLRKYTCFVFEPLEGELDEGESPIQCSRYLGWNSLKLEDL